MNRTRFPLFLIGCAFMLSQCTHDPFPPKIVEVPVMPSDTSDTIDTTTTNGNECHPDTAYFEKDVLPIILGNCANSCHNPNGDNDGVLLTDYASIMSDGEVRPSDPNGSDLYELITESDPDKRMPPPPNAALSDEDIATIRKWIEQGALDNTCDFDTTAATDPCDPQNVSFANDVTPLLTSYGCIGCHSGGAVVLNSYSGVKTVADNGRLLGAIKHDAGFDAMPQGQTKMDSCDIATIEIWINEGTLDN